MAYKPKLHIFVDVGDVSDVFHISGVTSGRVWVSDYSNLILTDTTGDTIHRVTDISTWYTGLHTVNSFGELIYIDGKHNINKLSVDNKIVTRLLESPTPPWILRCVYCSPFTGDLMVGMSNYDTKTGKIIRYNSSGKHVLTIQQEDISNKLYSVPHYITENKNGDVIVSDFNLHALVVTERGGRHRFSYIGPPPGSSLLPCGICTDPLSHILVCDRKTDTVQMIDKDGQFLSLFLTQRHGIYKPISLSYDDKSHLLWVGSKDHKTVSVYRYNIQRIHSLAGEKRKIGNVESSIEDEVTGPIASKLKIPGEASLKAAVISVVHPIKHEIRDVDRPDYSKMPSKKKEYWKGTNKQGVTKKPFTLAQNSTFNKTLDHLKETGEADIRMKTLVTFLDIEENPHLLSRSQMINMDYREIIAHIDYLDCVGLDFGMTKKSLIQCLLPFRGRRGKGVVRWIEVCKHVLKESRSTQWSSISSVLFAIYAKEAILKFKDKELTGTIDYIMQCAMEIDNYLLAFEIVKTYLFDNVIQLQTIFQDTKGISPVIIRTVLQTSRKMILRKFPNLQSYAISLSFCCDCGGEDQFVMVLSYRGKKEIPDRIPNEIMGLKLVLYNFTEPSGEALIVFKTAPVSKKTPLPTVTEDKARELFRKHSNLTMISASPYKSIGYSTGKHKVVERLCINLFCLHKGYIPYGEERFPKQLGNFEVDVQEGYCRLGTGRSLESGGHIKRLESGSIGGFVDIPNNKVGLITCAHVVFSPEELVMLINGQRPCTAIEVEAFDKSCLSFTVCGRCVYADFPQCDQIGRLTLESASKDPNVDAALIELDQDIDTFEFRSVTPEQLQSAGFDPSNPPVFSGEAVSLPGPDPVHRVSQRIPNTLDSVVKYGAETGFTIGNLYHSPVHVRFVLEKLDLPGNSHCAIMCDQIEIQNLPQGQFFECGDSGSIVYCINSDKTLSCLGMAVGISPRNSCLVTPIGRVLENVRLGSDLKVRLKPYGTSKRASQLSSNTHVQQQSTNSTTSKESQLVQLIREEMPQLIRREISSSLETIHSDIKLLKDFVFPSSSQNSSANPPTDQSSVNSSTNQPSANPST